MTLLHSRVALLEQASITLPTGLTTPGLGGVVVSGGVGVFVKVGVGGCGVNVHVGGMGVHVGGIAVNVHVGVNVFVPGVSVPVMGIVGVTDAASPVFVGEDFVASAKTWMVVLSGVLVEPSLPKASAWIV